MKLRISKAKTRQMTIIRNMMSLYLHDLSPFFSIELDDSGCYEYPYLDRYWTEMGRFPYLILVNERICGFVLVRKKPKAGIDYEIEEFFVLKRYRKKGIGESVARKLFRKYSGRWEVQCLRKNTPAISFWKSVIYKMVKENYSETINKKQTISIMLRFSSA